MFVRETIESRKRARWTVQIHSTGSKDQRNWTSLRLSLVSSDECIRYWNDQQSLRLQKFTIFYLDPSTCCFLSTSKSTPTHLWDAFSGQVRKNLSFCFQKCANILSILINKVKGILCRSKLRRWSRHFNQLQFLEHRKRNLLWIQFNDQMFRHNSTRKNRHLNDNVL